MRHIVLISCVKRKGTHRTQSQNLYQSDLFRKSMKFASSLSPDAIYILSAKHGLLGLEEEIDPYDETLKKMPIGEIRLWAERVIHQLRQVADLRNDLFTFLAADRYRRFLLPQLPHHEIPMLGLGIGKQLKFLKEQTT